MTKGYIVLGTNGTSKHCGEDRTLWSGGVTTLFPTYDRARCAIKRSATFSKSRGYDWGTEAWRIKRVVGEKGGE